MFAPPGENDPSARYAADRAAVITTQNDDGSVFHFTGCSAFGANHNSYRVCGTVGQIENIRTIKQSISLQEEMIRSYCLLVKRHSLNKYSYYVGQAITLVQHDLTADLKLKTIAEKLNVNSSYLSTLFHREYGCTLTEFVNKERMNRGILLLQMTTKPIQDIAAECGIQDVNYFIKLFKKQTGFTPNRYREQIGKQPK